MIKVFQIFWNLRYFCEFCYFSPYIFIDKYLFWGNSGENERTTHYIRAIDIRGRELSRKKTMIRKKC